MLTINILFLHCYIWIALEHVSTDMRGSTDAVVSNNVNELHLILPFNIMSILGSRFETV